MGESSVTFRPFLALRFKKQHAWGDLSDAVYQTERDATRAALGELADGDRIRAFDAYRARDLAVPQAIAVASLLLGGHAGPQHRFDVSRVGDLGDPRGGHCSPVRPLVSSTSEALTRCLAFAGFQLQVVHLMDTNSIIIVVVIVLIVLFVLGYFGRGRFRG